MYKWQSLALLFFIGAINYADRTALSAVFPLVQRDLGMSNVGLAAIGSLFLWSYAIGSPIAGAVADRFPRSRMIFWSLVGWSAVTMATALVRNQEQLFLARVLLGMAECAYLPAAFAFISDYHQDKTRATAMGIHMVGLSFGMIAGATLAGYIGEHSGWRRSMLVLAIAGFIFAALAKIVLRDAESKRPAGPARGVLSMFQDFALLLRIPTFRYLLGSAMMVSLGVWIFLNWLPLYINEKYGMSLAAAGFSGTFAPQLAVVVGTLGGGVLSDRLARRHPERRMVVGVFTYIIAAPFLLAFLATPGILAINMCVFAYSSLRAVGTVNEPTIACDLLPRPQRAAALGIANMANCLAGGVGVMVAGFLKADYGLGGVFAGVSVIMLIAAGLLLAGYSLHYRRDRLRIAAAAEEGKVLI